MKTDLNPWWLFLTSSSSPWTVWQAHLFWKRLIMCSQNKCFYVATRKTSFSFVTLDLDFPHNWQFVNMVVKYKLLPWITLILQHVAIIGKNQKHKYTHKHSNTNFSFSQTLFDFLWKSSAGKSIHLHFQYLEELDYHPNMSVIKMIFRRKYYENKCSRSTVCICSPINPWDLVISENHDNWDTSVLCNL